MRGWSFILSVALLSFVVTGCKPQRTRRPRTAPPPVPAEKNVDDPVPSPPPRPRPTAESRAVPVPAQVDRSTCGPSGKGPRFAVHGVDPSDTLNVRAAPDAKSDVLGQLLPTTTGVVGVGQQRQIGPSTWRKVKCGALIGWVNDRFLDPDGGEGPGAKAVTAAKPM